MEKHLATGLDEALKQIALRVFPLDAETIDLSDSVDRVAAVEMFARIDSPSVDASLKDGYAVVSRDVAAATLESPVRLRLTGCAAAGGEQNSPVAAGTTVQVLTGAKIPEGADSVVSSEFATPETEYVRFVNNAEAGRNILPRGADVTAGTSLVAPGSRLSPGMVGLLAAAGHSRVEVFRSPSVGIVATGDEIVAPGLPLPEGKLYASNITALGAWCRRFKMETRMAIIRDDPGEILHTLTTMAGAVDAIITSGGAWTSDRDLVAGILTKMGWEQVFHRIRIGPGKAVGFGMLSGKPVFILPGGPPSNLMAFLQIALPGLMRLGGSRRPGLPETMVRLASELKGSHANWTQFIFGTIETKQDLPVFHSLLNESRLRSMAKAEAIVCIPEGRTVLAAGSVAPAQIMS